MEIPKLLDGRLKLRHLVLVDALSSRGSVVGAALALHVTQPVVTRGLQELEKILGVTLYERGARGIKPNEFGVAFTEHARSVLAQLILANRHLEEIADSGRGSVVIGTHLAGSNLLIPRAIAHLKRHRPMLRVTVREATPESLREDLVSGRIDLIVGRLSGPAVEGMNRTSLYDETVLVFARVGHRLSDQSEVTLRDLIDYPWILPGDETALRTELEGFFTRHGYRTPVNHVEATAFLTVRQLLLETDMVAALPGLIGASDPRLVALPISLDLIGSQVGLTVASGRRLSPAAEAMIASLAEVAQTMRDGPSAP